MGKGSSPRPYSVPKDKFNEQFDAIFGKKKDESKQSNEGTSIGSEGRSKHGEESAKHSTDSTL